MKKPAAPTKTPTPEGERIAKYLSRAGVASRREAERMIELGQVAVNGKVIDSPALNIGPKDRITVNGKPVAQPEPARLWLYYKPEGLVTSASDEKGRETVFDNLPEDMPRVMSVGRLDLNSEGLLLLTNDGELKRRLELPSTGWLRKYRVRVKGNPTDVDLEPLRKGITVDGERFQPMQVVMDRHQGANAWLTVGLREGRNREIRRAMAEIGLAVNRLIRVSYGPFRLNELQPGDVEEVRPKVLRDQLGLEGAAADDQPGKRSPRPAPRGASADRPARPASAGTGGKPRASFTRGGGDAMDTRPPRTTQSRRSDGDAPRGTYSKSPRREDAEPASAPRRFGTAASKTRDAAETPRNAPATRRGAAPKSDGPAMTGRAGPKGPRTQAAPDAKPSRGAAKQPAKAPARSTGAKPAPAKPAPTRGGPARPGGAPGRGPRKA